MPTSRPEAVAAAEPVVVARRRIRVTGTVQGVGFRPFVYRAATRLGLAGTVGNDAGGAVVEAEGPAPALDALVEAIAHGAPPLARVDHVEVTELAPTGATGFAIAPSRGVGASRAAIPVDVATCEACLAELRDPADRRHRHPFITCTDCGPRYTIARGLPYDRPATTMASFAMCAACEAEYHDPADRRFHAQPVCCHDCGPRLTLDRPDGAAMDGDPLERAAALLRAGAVVAVKGVGGYHLAVDATDEAAAAALRTRKHREDKPFAVLVADLDAARARCHVDADEAALLTDPARPIVLLRRRADADVAPSVAPDNRRLGLMLPPTGLHHLLLAEVGRPLVLTSGNVSDEPIAHRDGDARARLASIVDAFLWHDRPIHVRVDDSVARVVAGRPGLLRRSRGFVPRPVRLPVRPRRPVLAVGAELKSTVCLARDDEAVVSHHLGDLEDYPTYRAFLEAIEHLTALLELHPAVVAHDLHPEYLSTKRAVDLADAAGLDAVPVQHHHAHIASCLADNGTDGPVIGLALDGLGWGPDDTVWGGEVLVADLAGFERVGHLETVPMPGGERAIREPWRMAAAHLDAAFDGRIPDGMAVAARNAARWDDVVAVARGGVNAPATSSAGRLFDAVAAICGVRDRVTYEGQAAVELEQLADPSQTSEYPVELLDGAPFRLPAGAVLRAVVEHLADGAEASVVAGRFHHTVAGVLARACERVGEERGLSRVALSGGVFQNALLVEATGERLRGAGFEVLTHRRLPPNDGGVSLGQAAVAAARDPRR